VCTEWGNAKDEELVVGVQRAMTWRNEILTIVVAASRE